MSATRDATPRSPAVAPGVTLDHRITGIPREDASQLVLGRRPRRTHRRTIAALGMTVYTPEELLEEVRPWLALWL